jgi:glycogen(starch) synthase
LSIVHYGLPIPDTSPSGIPFGSVKLLGVGRLIVDKGFDLAIRALALLRRWGVDAGLAIAGRGPEEGNLKALALQLDLSAHVDFLGWVAPDRVPALIDASTIVLMPSRWPEPFGLVALQAAQMGRPAIVSDVGGLPEVVDHGQTGIAVKPDDEHALAIAIQRLSADRGEVRRLGANARRRAIASFDFNTMVDRYESLFRETLAARASGRSGGR